MQNNNLPFDLNGTEASLARSYVAAGTTMKPTTDPVQQGRVLFFNVLGKWLNRAF